MFLVFMPMVCKGPFDNLFIVLPIALSDRNA